MTPERLRQHTGKTVIVGSGIAGLMAALTVSPEPVVLLTRSALGRETSSAWAQGGIAASLAPDDDVAFHLADTLAAGDGLSAPEMAADILAAAPSIVAALEKNGVNFDRDAQGELLFGLEAAHCRRRIIHAEGDGSGASIIRALTAAVLQTPSIEVMAGVDVRRLIADDGIVAGLHCAGEKGTFTLLTGKVILATGGIGGLYDATTNPTANFGQGIMLAARAGAMLTDMEFVQFHPTALASARRPLALVSEAVRGEGATLLNEKNERFMANIPGQELAARDIVARAIEREIVRGGRVFLDARKALGSRFSTRFPSIDRLCKEAGIDPSRDLIPVRPAVHYHMGGVATDRNGRSSLPGLWVAGEAACTGLHGANRLASNSLLEAAVMGMRAAQDACSFSAPLPAGVSAIGSLAEADPRIVRPLVSRHLGITRNAAGLKTAIAGLLQLTEQNGPASDPAIVGLSIAVFAALRQESRGAHFRDDFPLKGIAERRSLCLDEILSFARDISSNTIARSA
ncbi:L-aspartate oxidase [Agrobacterium sp. NPDC090273]|uniref:L-aspartate oxidase n=1 Tax=Agrobacterium sp. NPDC090273 TaxID=3363919 RepID=UPI00383AC716